MKRPDGGNPGFAPDLFGPGKNGFKDDPLDPPATQLDAAMFNNIVESLCRLVEDSGQVLDGLDFDQVSQAVQSAILLNPVVADGGLLTLKDSSELLVKQDGGNGGSLIRWEGTNAVALFQSGAVLQTVIGAVVQLLGSITVGTSAAQTMTVNSIAEFNENVSLAASKILTLGASAQVSGPDTAAISAGTFSSLSADGIVAPGELQFFSDAAPSASTGVMQFDGSSPTIGEGGVARRISVPVDSYVAGVINTPAGIADTGASVTLNAAAGERFMVEMKSEMTSDAAGTTVQFQIEASAAIIGGVSPRYIDVAGVYTECSKSVEYQKIGAGVVQFKARYGQLGGNTTSARNILLTVRRKN
jgi:hypothetical protein